MKNQTNINQQLTTMKQATTTSQVASDATLTLVRINNYGNEAIAFLSQQDVDDFTEYCKASRLEYQFGTLSKRDGGAATFTPELVENCAEFARLCEKRLINDNDVFICEEGYVDRNGRVIATFDDLKDIDFCGYYYDIYSYAFGAVVFERENECEATTFKIKITNQRTGTEHIVNGQAEYHSISDAMKKALSEMERMLSEYGILEEKARENEWDLNWCLDNCLIQLELQKYEGDDIKEIRPSDYDGVEAELMAEFESKFQTTGWAVCKTDLFYYSE